MLRFATASKIKNLNKVNYIAEAFDKVKERESLDVTVGVLTRQGLLDSVKVNYLHNCLNS